ncbi:MAG TPA: nucleotide exchange factor GrpE, partial [Solirubrobacteraceae bacterium]|nr:nucleotide exchange factor GrpE [Solirubrobacteraceae bacterium]
LLEGVRLVRSELAGALARAGIESFSPAGEPFDPALHEAVATAEQPEGGAASGTVVEVYQSGYRLRDSIIRPARVVVAA